MPLNQYTEYKTSKVHTEKTMRIVKTESLALNNQTVWCAILFLCALVKEKVNLHASTCIYKTIHLS